MNQSGTGQGPPIHLLCMIFIPSHLIIKFKLWFIGKSCFESEFFCWTNS